MDLIPEAQWNALCYQNKAFKIYVQSLNKVGGGYKIFDVSGNKSRYNPQAPVSTTVATLTKPSALLGTPLNERFKFEVAKLMNEQVPVAKVMRKYANWNSKKRKI